MKKMYLGFDKLVILLLYWLPLQDLLMGVIYRFTHSVQLTSILLYTKDVFLLILLIMCCLRKQKLTQINKLIILYIVIILFNTIATLGLADVGLSKLVASSRGLLLCPFFLFIGSNIRNADRFVEFLKNNYFKYIFILGVIGIVEVYLDLTVGTKSFWQNIIGIGDMYNNVKGDPNTYMGLPGNFYGYSAAGFFTGKRLVSLWGNPLTSAYSMLIPAVYYITVSFFIKNKLNRNYKQYMFVLVFVCAIILSYTRAIILGMVIAIMLLFLYKNRNRVSNIVVAIVMSVCVLIIYLFAGETSNIYAFLYDGSTKSHIDALISNVNRIGLFGAGVGNFGATESGYFSVWGQVGLLGLILFILINYKAIRNAFNNTWIYQEMAIAVAFSWIVFMITALISEQLTAFTTIAPAYVILGVVQNKRYGRT